VATFNKENCGEIRSVDGYIRSLNDVRARNKDRKLWYRGHSDQEYKLIPSIGRLYKYAGNQLIFDRKQERNLLHRFRRRIYPHLGRAITAGEALFLARHHRLPTRLIDWTANALYALYFACIVECDDTSNKHGRVWAILRTEEDSDIDAFDLAAAESEEKLFAILELRRRRTKTGPLSVKIIPPFYNSPRILAQDGAFTVHSDPWRPLDDFCGEDFNAKHLDIGEMYHWTILARSKGDILRQLSGLGITHRMVYPDLDGIARSLWETEALWKGKPSPR
jgi:FRG domain